MLLGIVLLRDSPRDAVARASAGLLAAVVGHLVFPLAWRAGLPPVLLHPVLLAAASVPFAFWLLAQLHFDDEFRPASRHAGLLVATAGTSYLAFLVAVEGRGGGLDPASREFWLAVPRLLGTGLVLHALLRIHSGRAADLVLSRLRARFLVLTVAGTYLLLELLGELVLAGPAAAVADQVHSATSLAIVFGACLVGLRPSPVLLRPPRVAETAVADPLLLERLRRTMEAEYAYRQEGLTIGAVAERLGVGEHKLRELINTQLGFKNFNTFLHHYRIAEAERLLQAPDDRRGVAEIAYAVGYRSLATFNKAFKDLTGRTPTEARGARR